MLACFFMVLGQLPLRKIVPPTPGPTPTPGGGGGGGGAGRMALFLGDNGLVTFPHNCSLPFLPIVATI